MSEIITLPIAIPVDIYDKDGNLTKIEFNDPSGVHIIDAEWDHRDPQDSKHRTEFRKWAYRFVEQKGYRIHK
jgi:hypothetical protein